MSQSPYLEAMKSADAAPVVADRNARRKQLLGGAALAGLALFAAYTVLATSGETRTEVRPVDEEFNTTSFRPPSFLRDEEKPAKEAPEIVKIEPPVERVDTTTFDVPPPPPPITARVDAHVPAPAAIEPEPVVEEFPARFRSKLINMDNQSASGGLMGGNGQTAGAGNTATVAGDDANSKYLASASALGDRSAKATKIQRLDAVIPEGTLIPGILETAIVSDLPGQIRAITADDVYSFDGRRILIPTGTRLIGEYQSSVTRGQKRVFVVWTRLIRSDGVSIRLNSIGTDGLGRSGLTGIVDNKWKERFGSAILLSIVGAGSSYATGYGSDSLGGGSDSDNGADLARETIAETFSDMANQALGENLRIPPTISVNQGERIFIFVRQDLDFSTFYDDPVSEAMREIQRERHGQ